MLSRALFQYYNIEDDAIVASMHEYVGKNSHASSSSSSSQHGKKEEEEDLLEEMKSSLESLQTLLYPPEVIEYDFTHSQQQEDVLSLHSCKTLVHRVRHAMNLLVNYLQEEKKENDENDENNHVLDYDEMIEDKLHLRIRQHVFHPVEALSSLSLPSHHNEDGSNKKVLNEIISSFITALDLNDEVTLSYGQYVMLCNLYANEKGIIEEEEEEEVEEGWLVGLRSGRLCPQYALCLHPILAYLLQLAERVRVSKKKEKMNTNNPEEGEEVKESEDEVALRQALHCLECLQHSRELIQQGHGHDQTTTVKEALQTLSLPCLPPILDPSLPPLPRQLVCAMLVERANCHVLVEDFANALSDLSQAIAIDRHCGPAYSLRSTILLRLLSRSNDPLISMHQTKVNVVSDVASIFPLSKEEETSIRNCLNEVFPSHLGCVINEEDLFLHHAAEDAMLGFLLTGSTDIELAATAEEVANEAVRKFAKQVYRAKVEGDQSKPAGNEQQQDHPKPWLMTSYFGAYSHPAQAYNLYGPVSAATIFSSPTPALEELHDIDEDDIDQSGRGSGKHHHSHHHPCPPPPGHLLDPLPGSQGVDSSGEEKEVRPLCKAQDSEAYSLLLALVQQMNIILSCSSTEDMNNEEEGKEKEISPYDDIYEEILRRAGLAQAGQTIINGKVVQQTFNNIIPEKYTEVETNDCVIASDDDVFLQRLLGERSDKHFSLVSEGVMEEVSAEDLAASNPSANASSACSTSHNLSMVASAAFATMVSLVQSHADLLGVHIQSNGVVTRLDHPCEPIPFDEVEEEEEEDVAEAHHHLHFSTVLDDPYEQYNHAWGEDGLPDPLQHAWHEMDEEDDEDGDDDEEGHHHDRQDDIEHARLFFEQMMHGVGVGVAGGSGRAKKHHEDEEGSTVWEDMSTSASSNASDEDDHDDHDDNKQTHKKPSVKKDIEKPPEVDVKPDHKIDDEGSSPSNEDRGVEPIIQEAEETLEGVVEEPPSDAEPPESEGIRGHYQDEDDDEEEVVPPPPIVEVEDSPDPYDPHNNTSEGVEEEMESDVYLVEESPDAEEEEEKEEEKATAAAEEPPVGGSTPIVHSHPTISRHIIARLLNATATVVYLLGHHADAIQLLTSSLNYDPLLTDSRIKLAALYSEGEEVRRSASLLDEVLTRHPDHAVALLHYAEVEIHRNAFPAALGYLRRARQLLDAHLLVDAPSTTGRHLYHLPPTGEVTFEVGSLSWALSFKQSMLRSHRLISANIIAMLGAAHFRIQPNSPEVAVRTLEEGLCRPGLVTSSALVLCLGDVHCQCGDMVKAIKLYQAAQVFDPTNPLPFLNASRAYAQLSQRQHSLAHLRAAEEADSSCVLVYVDLARSLRSQGLAEESAQCSRKALGLAKQVSDFREVLAAQYLALLILLLERKGLVKKESTFTL
eukprot:scaffold5931_cov173-Ochromonas_danica.AAC.4